MREKVIKIPIHGKALCIFSDGNLLCYRGGVFRLYDAKSYAVIKKFKLPNKKFCKMANIGATSPLRSTMGSADR